MMRCGECGAMITAEEKINRYGTRYIYYHCTKRVNPNCTQRSVELGDLEKQIDEILSNIEIPESFKDWAIEYLNELHDQESREQIMIDQNLDGSYSDCLVKIQNLIKLKISPLNKDSLLLSDDDYQQQMATLQKEKNQLEQQRKQLGERVDKWEELSRNTYNFARYARYHFRNGTHQDKRHILQTIGSHLLLKDKELTLDVPKPFKIIEGSKIEIEKIMSRLEPQ